MDPRERAFEKALRQLTPVFQRKLAAKDVRHDLYGKEQLTWSEYERIGESLVYYIILGGVEMGVVNECVVLGVARTDGEAADELMKALRRREPSVLDILVECLKEQEEANADLIKKIHNGRYCWLLLS